MSDERGRAQTPLPSDEDVDVDDIEFPQASDDKPYTGPPAPEREPLTGLPPHDRGMV